VGSPVACGIWRLWRLGDCSRAATLRYLTVPHACGQSRQLNRRRRRCQRNTSL
jgi:hypothetical protein